VRLWASSESRTYNDGTDDQERWQYDGHAEVYDQNDLNHRFWDDFIEYLGGEREREEVKIKVIGLSVIKERQLTIVLKSIFVVRMMTMVVMASKIPNVPAIIVPVFKL
jgi:hypothetical protein